MSRLKLALVGIAALLAVGIAGCDHGAIGVGYSYPYDNYYGSYGYYGSPGYYASPYGYYRSPSYGYYRAPGYGYYRSPGYYGGHDRDHGHGYPGAVARNEHGGYGGGYGEHGERGGHGEHGGEHREGHH